MIKASKIFEELNNEESPVAIFKDSENKKAVTISIASGKGGVGKTTFAVGLGLKLAREGKKILLIDLDYNLSNTVIKLGLSINNNFYNFIKSKTSFFESIYRLGNLHILGGGSGNLEFFERKLAIDRLIIDVISEYENYYDYILLDSPSGATKEILTLNALCDHRFILVNPDKSSITDSYSLIKLMKISFGVDENYIIVNKILKDSKFNKISKVLSEMCNSYLGIKINILGKINELDNFDDIYEINNEAAGHNFNKILDELWGNFSKYIHINNGYSENILKQKYFY